MRSAASPGSSASAVATAASPSLAHTREGRARPSPLGTRVISRARCRRLEERVNKRRGGLAGHHQYDYQRQDEHEGHDPVDLVLAGELEDLADERADVAELAHDSLSPRCRSPSLHEGCTWGPSGR